MFAQPIRIAARSTDPRDNQRSTADTLALMSSLCSASKNSPKISVAVLDACKGLSDECSTRDICEAIWYWIKSKVKFVTDEQTMIRMGIPIDNPTKDLLISPEALLSMPEPQGDCDDFSMLAKAMLAQCGIPASFVTVKADKEDDRIWSHVYCKAYLGNGESMMFDASHGEWPGWETKNYWEKREWL